MDQAQKEYHCIFEKILAGEQSSVGTYIFHIVILTFQINDGSTINQSRTLGPFDQWMFYQHTEYQEDGKGERSL